MKRFYQLLTALLLLVASTATANDVIVKGYVKYPDGKPAVNHKVYISVDTLVNALTCLDSKLVTTNENGFYIATLSCTSNIVKVIISVPNCNGTVITERPQVSPPGIVERNFTICHSSSQNCEASFRFEHSETNRLKVSFNSTASHGISLNDVIVKRRWKFGDGTTLEGNEINPVHLFPSPGSYEVCLTIVTAGACEKTICKRIVIEDNSKNCLAYFRMQASATNGLVYHFNSDSSKGAFATDQIIKRIWRFGDGTVLEGNVVNPEHTFAAKGVYEVCLTIKTASGCEKTICKKLVIDGPINTSCKPEFIHMANLINPYQIKFNSVSSSVANGDSIISRHWNFGNGKTATTIDPVHVYEKNGVYNVCLKIKTARGCEKEFCKTIIINERKCEAKFVYELHPLTAANAGFDVRFNSNSSESNDSIISRKWTFGDGTSDSLKNPKHTYKQPGLYTVCLTIKTANGCENKECKQVLVGPNAQNCSPNFTFERIGPKKIRFNSAMSWAAVGDSIVQRRWDFGDGLTPIAGNQLNIVKEFNRPGSYTVCLVIKTARGCEKRICHTVKIEDSSVNNSSVPIKIVTLFPSPVQTRMTADVWSLNDGVRATIAIYDIYGVKKWEEQKVLSKGNNINVIATGFLLHGPYFLRVTTMYGVQSRAFFKL